MKKLMRSRTNHMIGGVCGGLAEYMNIDPTFVRLGFVLFLFFGVGFFVYVVLWVITPYQSNAGESGGV